jgi:hypothetical protein
MSIPIFLEKGLPLSVVKRKYLDLDFIAWLYTQAKLIPVWAFPVCLESVIWPWIKIAGGLRPCPLKKGLIMANGVNQGSWSEEGG